MNNFVENIKILNSPVRTDNDNKYDYFVGLKFLKDKINIYFPIGYNLDDFNEITKSSELTSNMIKEIDNLLNTISIAKTLSQSSTEFGIDSGEKEEIPFNSFRWLLNDYLENGLYTETEKIVTQNARGKINWKKTLNSEHYFSNEGVVFISPYYNKNIYENNIITNIHAFCVNKSIDYISWLYGRISYVDTNIDDDPEMLFQYISIIDNVLMKTFNDRKKWILRHIKRILLFLSNDIDFENENYGVDKFDYVWEEMVRKVLGNENPDKFYPTSIWRLLSGEKTGCKMRPDAIRREEISNNGENKLFKYYILDAKYYKYGVSGSFSDLPNTDSVQKQVTYGDHIANHLDWYDTMKDKIYNAFVLPFDCKNSENKIEYKGYAYCDWRDREIKTTDEKRNYERVAIILVDTKYLIDCYFKIVKPEIHKLIENIEKASKAE